MHSTEKIIDLPSHCLEFSIQKVVKIKGQKSSHRKTKDVVSKDFIIRPPLQFTLIALQMVLNLQVKHLVTIRPFVKVIG